MPNCTVILPNGKRLSKDEFKAYLLSGGINEYIKDGTISREQLLPKSKKPKESDKLTDSREAIGNIQKNIDKEMAKENPNQEKIDKLRKSKEKEIDSAIESKFGMKLEDIMSTLGDRIKTVKC